MLKTCVFSGKPLRINNISHSLNTLANQVAHPIGKEVDKNIKLLRIAQVKCLIADEKKRSYKQDLNQGYPEFHFSFAVPLTQSC